MQYSVLIVEDERKIRDLLRSYLEHDGLAVLTTWSGAEAITLVREATPDLVVLDLGLPDVTGQDVVREVRSFTTTPILILTARDDTRERINCLELGADDYVTKPFSPREVALRVRAILRRLQPDTAAVAEVASYGSGELVLDEPRMQATVRGQPVELTATEWKLISTLAAAPGRVYSRYELINRIRGYDSDGYERIVDSHVRNLRHKVEADRTHPRLVQTVYGTGYRFGLPRDKPPRPAGRTG